MISIPITDRIRSPASKEPANEESRETPATRKRLRHERHAVDEEGNAYDEEDDEAQGYYLRKRRKREGKYEAKYEEDSASEGKKGLRRVKDEKHSDDLYDEEEEEDEEDEEDEDFKLKGENAAPGHPGAKKDDPQQPNEQTQNSTNVAPKQEGEQLKAPHSYPGLTMCNKCGKPKPPTAQNASQQQLINMQLSQLMNGQALTAGAGGQPMLINSQGVVPNVFQAAQGLGAQAQSPGAAAAPPRPH